MRRQTCQSCDHLEDLIQPSCSSDEQFLKLLDLFCRTRSVEVVFPDDALKACDSLVKRFPAFSSKVRKVKTDLRGREKDKPIFLD